MGATLPDLGHERLQQLQGIADAHREALLNQQSDYLNNALNNPNLDQQDESTRPTDPTELGAWQAENNRRWNDRNKLIFQRAALMTPQESGNLISDIVNHIHGHIAGSRVPGTQTQPQAPSAPSAVPASSTLPTPPPVVPSQTGAAPAPSSASSLNLGAPPAPQPTFGGSPALTPEAQPVTTSATVNHPFQPIPPGHPLHGATKIISDFGNWASGEQERQRQLAQAQAIADQVSRNYLSPTGEQERIAEAKLQRAKDLKAAPSGASRPVPMNGSSVALEDALKLSEAGQEFNDQNGNQIDLEGLRDSKVPVKITPVVKGQQTFYVVSGQKTRLETIGNEVYALPETGTTNAADLNADTALGQKSLGTEAAHQVPGVPGEGPVTLTSSRTPVTAAPAPVPAPQEPKLVPRAAAAASQTPVSANAPGLAATNAQIQAANAASPKLNKGKKVPVSAPTAALTPQPSELPPAPTPLIHGMTLSQGRAGMATVQKIGPIQAQIFGEAGLPPIWTYTDLFKDPKTAAAINLALTMNTTPIPGINDDDTKITATAARILGLTRWAQMSQHDQAVAARQAVAAQGPRATELLNRLAELKGSVSSLRSATGAPATESAAQTMIQEAPIYNLSSPQDFTSRISNFLTTATGTLRNTPGINPAYTEWWANGSRQARTSNGATPVSANVPTPPTGDGTPRPAGVPDGYVHRDGPQGKGWYAPQ